MLTNLPSLPGLPDDESGRILSRIIAVAVLTLVAHLLVWVVRFVSDWIVRKSAAKKSPIGFVTRQPKFITFTGLVSSALTFTIYFLALGYILVNVFHLNLTAYLATASVIGLAVGFGSQGLVQDIVTSLTLILSDTMDVGDMIEVSGQIGRVEKVGLRFTELTNFLNQQVFIPNRMIAHIARFPQRGIHAFVDIQIPAKADRKQLAESIHRIARGMWIEFDAIILGEPELSEVQTVEAGAWSFIRVQFRIWPGQGALLETTFRQRIVDLMKSTEPGYMDWMVPVTYRANALSTTEVTI
jgi:moderate conductance mechanosensitive channel